MTLGDWITWAMAAAGIYGLSSLAWQKWGSWIRDVWAGYGDLVETDRDDHYVANEEAKNEQHDGTQYRDIPDTYQPEPASIDATSTSIFLANTTDLVRHLASLRKANGDYAMSANRIVAAVEMGRNDVLDIVRSIRGTDPIEPYDAAKHLMVDGGKRIIPR